MNPWIPRTSSFGTTKIWCVAHSLGTWVAAGDSGKLATAPDGVNWTQRTSSFGSDPIYGVAHNGVDLWVAVASAGKLATSSDGVNWTQQTSSFSSTNIHSVAYDGSGLWVAVGADGKLATSTDGAYWTQRTLGLGTVYLTDVAHNGTDLWVVVAVGGQLATSSDGINWISRTSSFGAGFIHGVAHNNIDLWVAGGAGGKLATSPGGIDWTQQTSSFGTSLIQSVAHNGTNLWVAVGGNGKLATLEQPYTQTGNISDYKTESWTVSKSVTDALWVLSAKIDKHDVPPFFEQIRATATDHDDVPHTLFVGISPTTDLMLATAADKATVTGYDYGWYLTVQYVPSGERITETDTDPSETITTILGGTTWASVTGIEPHRINTVAAWEDIKKSFEFGDRCTRWQAIQEICEYCNHVFAVKWRNVGDTWTPSAYFVHEDDIDSSTAGLDLPAEITITDPDPHLITGISVKDSPEHQYNRVLVSGSNAATATAQTAAVTAGTEIPIEYVYADAALTTQAMTDLRAQELLDFFQASAKVYTAKLVRRVDLELYQKISFSGYQKIEQDTMRITRITYSRSTTSIVEIEFSKDQAIQQLRRIERAVNPDYVSGTLDMMNSDLSDLGLIDVFDEPLAGGTASDDLWITSGAYVQLFSPHPLDLQGWSVDGASGVRGRSGADFSLWGGAGSQEGEGIIEFLRWHNYESGKIIQQYLEIEEDIFINNDSQFPKIYFDIDSFNPTYIRGNTHSTMKGVDIYVAGERLVSFLKPEEANAYTHFQRDVKISPSLEVGGRIKGAGNNDLTFWDKATGTKTLSQLAAAGGEVEGLTNPMTTHLDMNGYDIRDCDDIDCDDIDCDNIDGKYFYCNELQTKQISVDDGGVFNVSQIYMSGKNSYIERLGYLDFYSRASAPSDKTTGTLYYDGYSGKFKYWNGSTWKTITST